MRKKEKATEAAPHTNKNICIRATIKALFRTGKKLTAKKINQLTKRCLIVKEPGQKSQMAKLAGALHHVTHTKRMESLQAIYICR